MEIEICKPTPEQEELQKLFAEVPSKEAIERATYLLNNYSKDSEADIICLALSIDRRLRESKQQKDILDQILREFPVGNIAEHTIESLPERISYYLKELAEYTQRVEDLEDKKLDPKQPICTKCINNLTYYDGWHCMCEEKDVDHNCWVNFDDSWEKCADHLIDFAEIIKATEGNSTRNSEYYNRACAVIETYKRLKNGI